MNILIISHYFPPLNSIASLRPYSWAKQWSKLGHNVTVLTTNKEPRIHDLHMDLSGFKVITYDSLHSILSRTLNLSKSPKDPRQRQLTRNKLSTQFIKYYRAFSVWTGAIGYDARMPNLICTKQRNAYKLIAKKWDLVVSTFAPYATHQLAYKLKVNHLAKKWIADYRDLWTRGPLYTGIPPFIFYEKYLESKINCNADIITTISPLLAHRIRSEYNANHIFVIENGFDSDDLECIPSNKYWDDRKVRLVYTGNIYKKSRDPSPLFEAIRRISISGHASLLDKLEVIFIGGRKAHLYTLINRYNVGKYVKHEGFLPREVALWMQRDAHALLFLERDAPKFEGTLTGKLFEYLYSGTQIMGIGIKKESASGALIHESAQGIAFGTDHEKIRGYLEKLLITREKKNVLINYPLLEKFSRKSLANKMLNLAV